MPALYRAAARAVQGRRSELLREVARHLALAHELRGRDPRRPAQGARPNAYERIRGELGATATSRSRCRISSSRACARWRTSCRRGLRAGSCCGGRERSGWLAKAHIGMKVRTTTVSGYLRVWLLAKLRPLAARHLPLSDGAGGDRGWLALVERPVVARRYGARAGDRRAGPPDQGLRRHARARLGQLRADRRAPGRAGPAIGRCRGRRRRVRAAREAALADPEGKSLDSALERERRACRLSRRPAC